MEKTDGKNVPIVLPVVDANEDPENETLHPNIPHFPAMCCIYANFRCIGENEMVITNFGHSPIKQVRVGEHVLSNNGFVEVLGVINCGLKEVYNIKVGDNSLICSEDHKLQTEDGMMPLKSITDELIYCYDGKYKISSRDKLKEKVSCWDLSVNSKEHTFLCNNISVSNSGKSVLLVNYLLNSDFYRNRFDRIYLYSPTAASDPSTQALTEDEGIEIISEPKEWESHLNALWDYQTENKGTPYEQKIAICMDDCVGNLGSRNSLLATLPCKSRHINCRFLCYISQSFKSLHPSIRSNTKSMIIMKLSNDAEREKIKMEVDGFLGGNFETLYNYAINDKAFSFLYLDFTANPCNAYLRHERLLYSEGKLMVDKKVEEEEEN